MTGQFGIGSDTTLSIISNGAILASTILTEFSAKQDTTLLKSVGLDGRSRRRHLEEGWQGTLAYDRADSSIDDYFAAKEASRYAGRQPPTVTITETTKSPSGAIAKYRYTGVTMKLDDIGSRTGDKKIEQKVSWECERRIKVL